jgi:hypothetical protein
VLPTNGKFIFRALKSAATVSFLLLMITPPAFGARAPSLQGPVNAYLYSKASNGYSAQLKSEGDKLQLIISRGLFPSLVYRFHGRVSAAGISARIADLGTIDLRFKPSGKTRHGRPPRNCSGPRATQIEGHFIGEFDFQAEQAVTKIDLTSAKGSLAAPGWHCRKESIDDFLQRAPSGSTYTFLQATDPGRKLGFSTFTGVDAEHPEALGTEVSASARTHRGPVTVDHLAVALAVNIFSFDSALTTATVTPPSPFRSSATYCRACSPRSQWTGDLSVLLPGLAHPVALTGPAYRASLKSFAGGGGSE